MSEGAFFFDSSGIVKRYANETGTQRVLSVTNPSANNTIFISKITPVEVISALSRKLRLEEVSPSDYEMMVTGFERDCVTQYIQVEPRLYMDSRLLVRRRRSKESMSFFPRFFTLWTNSKNPM